MLKANLKDIDFTIFDLETTGFLPEIGHEIISIGAIRINAFDEEETFYHVVRPIRPVNKHILDLTGLDTNQLKEAASFITVFLQFLEFSRNSVLVAHPAKFDMRFVKAMLKRWKLPVYDPPYIDSQAMAKWLLPTMNCQLDELIKHFHIQQLDRHHALNDALMTAELFQHLISLSPQHEPFSYLDLKKKLR
nr:3'-5' exonuclease [Thalassobacillus sp. CUG 92003]